MRFKNNNPNPHPKSPAELGSGTADGLTAVVALCPVVVMEKVSPAVRPARLKTALPEPEEINSGPFGGAPMVEFNSSGLASTVWPC